MNEEDVPAKLKHFNAQVAMVPQWSMAGPHGFASGGQQSCMSSLIDTSSVMDMSAWSGVWSGVFEAPAAAGSIATDRLTKSARMVRPVLMDQASRKIAAFPVSRSSDDFARCHGVRPSDVTQTPPAGPVGWVWVRKGGRRRIIAGQLIAPANT
jgi:hypothetical protein